MSMTAANALRVRMDTTREQPNRFNLPDWSLTEA